MSTISEVAVPSPSELLEKIVAAVPFTDPGNRLFWVYLACFVVLGTILYAASDAPKSFSGALRFCFPRSVFLHPSSLLDYRFYLINGVLSVATGFFAFVASLSLTSDRTLALLRMLFGAEGPAWQTTTLARWSYTLAALCAIDLGFFLAHVASHKVPILWEFHKVHHSATALNPVTNFRFHPLDRMVLSLFIGSLIGLAGGAFGYLFGEITVVEIMGASALLFFYNLTGNLRHSHLWLSFGWRLSHVVYSPVQHVIHHSNDPRHIDKNFGLVFSVWDWLFGSLYIPREREELRFGLLGGEHERYSSVWQLYMLPLRRAGMEARRLLLRR